MKTWNEKFIATGIKRRHFIAGLACSPFAFPSMSHAATPYPTRAVSLVCPWSPGASAGLLAQTVADKVALGQPMIVDFKPGAGGSIGAQMVASARPDGYTLLLSGFSSLLVSPIAYKAKYDPIKSFTNVAYLGGAPNVLVVDAASPIRSFQQFLESSRRDGFNVGTTGNGTVPHLVLETLRSEYKADLRHIPYKGSSNALTDLVGGRLDGCIVTSAGASQFVKSGKLRALAITSKRRAEMMQDVPTMTELGLPSMTLVSWFAVSAPAGLAPDIADRLNAEIRQVLKRPEVQTMFASEGIESEDMSRTALDTYVVQQMTQWKPHIERLDFKTS